MSAKKGRSYEKKFEVAAPPEAVWKAITEGEELTRWFCVAAESQPGVGGEQTIDWGGGMKATHKIVIWEPNAHLRTESRRSDLSPPESGEPYAIDWYLESAGGTTRVRMVASGFGEGADWDYEYDGTFHGWDFFHTTLKHYLENHRGKPANNVTIYATFSISREEAWDRLMSAEGLVKEGSARDLAIGAPFRFVTAENDVLAGVVRNLVPAKTFSGMVENLEKSILVIELAVIPGQGNFVYLALSTWGLAKADVDALGARLKSIVYRLFPQKTGEAAAGCAASGGEAAAQ
jgi:uncharacterized protein YndB with AHSA1/START domain